MHRLRDWFKALSPGTVAVICLALTALFAVLDRLASPQITFALFFALVVALAGWAGGKRVGAIVAVAGAFAGSADEWANSTGHVQLWTLCWNTAVRFGVFLFISWLAAMVRELTERLEEKVQRRTSELEQEIRERRRVEAQLRERTEQFRQLGENITGVLWIIDWETKQAIYVSPAYEKIWGRTCQSAKEPASSWLESIHPDDQQRIRDELNRRVPSHSDTQYRIIKPDGTTRWIRDRAFPIRDDSGKVFRVAGIAEDITEQELAEAARRDSETRYRSLVEAAQDVIFTISTDSTLTSLNAAFEVVTGWARQEWVGRSFAELVVPEDRLLAAAMFEQVARGEKTPIFEIQVRTKSGGLMVAQVSGTPQLKDGVVVGVLGIARDITERKQAEEKLQTQAKVLESMAEGLIVTDDQGFIVLTNPAADKLWGYAPEEWKGRHVTVLSPLPELQAKELLAFILKEVESRGNWSGEFENVGQDGRPFLTQAVITKLELGGRILFVSLQQDITEKRRAEETFRTQGLVLDNMTEGVVLVDESGIIRLTNPGLDTQFSYGRGELVGKHVTTLLRDRSAESGRRAGEIIGQVKTQGAWQGEFQNRRSDGTQFVTEVRMSRLEIGGKFFVVGVGQDITERKQAEEARLQSEERFRLAMDAASDGLWEWDITTSQTYYSPAYFRMLGYESGALSDTYRTWLDLIHPDDRERALAANQDCIENRREAFQVEFRMRAANGEWRWILGRGKAVKRDAAGKALLMIGTHVDITERKRAEEALQTQARVLESLFEGVSLVDENGVIRLTNPTMDAMFGYERGELLGKHVTVLNGHPPEENARVVDEVMQQIQAHGVYIGEFRNRKKDGRPFVSEARVSVLTIGDKRFFVSMQQDITERKRLESQILEVSDREQARIGQDLHDGLCQRLVSAGFDINRLTERLAALSLPETKVAGQTAEIIDDAITEARAVARGLFPVQLEADGLSAALQELAANVSARYRVDCHAHCPGPPLVRDNTVATHLYRIAQEAVNNALRHSQAKSIAIQLSTVGDEIELSVSDDGVGISTSPQSAGGMGLHIMNYRARTIGGTLSIGRAPAGVGTIVSCCARQRMA